MYGYGYRYNSGLVVGAGGGAPFLNTYSLDFDGVDDYVDCGIGCVQYGKVYLPNVVM